MLVTHATNRDGRDWVAGDIHGQYDTLFEALAQAGFDRKHDRLFQVGDLIDRGRDSFKCLSLAFEPWFFGVLGNHEQLALDAFRTGGSAWELWMLNGGKWVYSENPNEVAAVLEEAVKHLPLAREINAGRYRIGMVHAEPPQDWLRLKDAADVYRDTLTWGRKRYKAQDNRLVSGINAVVVGHTIVKAPIWLGNVLYLDTGAFMKDGYLTLVPLDEIIAMTPSDFSDRS
ncbi:metallophosphoesterase [Halomonas sediminis]